MPTTDAMMQNESGIFEGELDVDVDTTAVMTAEALARLLAEEKRIAARLRAERYRLAINERARPRSCRDDR
jgi:hypothetical protein